MPSPSIREMLRAGPRTAASADPTADLIRTSADGLAAILAGVQRLGVNADGSIDFDGAVSVAVRGPLAADATLGPTDDLVILNATAAARTATLPPATTAAGRRYAVAKSDASANPVTLAPSGADTVQGGASLATTVQYGAYTVESDGVSNWVVVATANIAGPPTGAAGGYLAGTYPNPTALEMANRAVAASGAGTNADGVLEVDASGAARTITLDAVATFTHRITVVKTDASANPVTVQGSGGELINVAATDAISAQGEAHTYHPIAGAPGRWRIV